ncbi:hypothetical protein FDA25_02495 [Clostridium botulinum]|nr:hypothetical protein [Clostridium botulinum]NFH71484.1 hypothetical protein [Clostridium botulinum]NFI79787.1 hypothetical protein [Clostridium botulinum]NFJ70903.1 hypothetical protein [Clostridium botulinum]NFM10014.1 hypothetical protein [Clostridium botulinum]
MNYDIHIMKNLADDFKKVVIEYRKARKEQEAIEEKSEERYYRREELTTSKNYVKLTRAEYWKDMIESKIKVIGCIGGFKFMQEFCEYLHEYEKEHCEGDIRLNLVSCFDANANGINGWYN